MNTLTATNSPSRTDWWILHPAIDLLFCCGGLFWLLVAVHYMFGWTVAANNSGIAPAVLLTMIAGLVLADTHNAATLVRLYGDSDIRKSLPHVAYTGAAAFLVLAVLCMQNGAVLGIALRVYFIFIAQHLTAQVYGISLIYCAKRKYLMTPNHRLSLQRTLQWLAIFAAVRFFADGGTGRSVFVGIAMPAWGTLPAWAMLFASLPLLFYGILFLRNTVLKARLDGQTLPFPAILLIFTTVFLFTAAPAIFDVIALYVPAFFHGAQYLVVTTSVRLKQTGVDLSDSRISVLSALLKGANLEYWGILLCLAISLYVIVPGACTRFGISFSVAFASIFAAVNLHHFLADSAIWKLRNPQVRKHLI
jgi:hypothetical protein